MPKSEIIIQIGKDGRTIISDVKASADPNDASNPEVKTFKAMSWSERWQYLKEFVTVEPLLFFYIFGIGLCVAAATNLQLQTSCLVDSGYLDEICEHILAGQSLEYNLTDEVQNVHLHISNVNAWMTPVLLIIPIILSLFWGSFSDRTQIRKPFLLLPLFGEFLGMIGLILATIFLGQWNITTTTAIASITSSLLGGQVVLVTALYSYIADISTVEQRTMRIAVCQTVIMVAQILSGALNGIMYTLIGYYGIFCTSACFLFIGLLYGVFYIKDNLIPRSGKRKCLLLDLFDPTLIVETALVLLVKKIGTRRLFVVAFMVVMFIYNGLNAGESSITFFYLQAQLGFTSVTFTYLTTFLTLISLKGTIMGTYLFTKLFKLSDYSIIILGFILKIICDLILAAAINKYMVYLAAYVLLFERLVIIALRSLLTKVVRQEDIGRVQSLLGVFETLGSVAFTPIYNSIIFTYTQKDFPSAFLYAPILFLGICILIVWFVKLKDQKYTSKTASKNENEQGVDNRGMTTTETEISHM